MAKISTVFNNFAHGKIDHDLNGRFGLPAQKSGSDVFRNFFSNFKGNGIYRPGFESFLKFQDCRMIEFKFNKAQSYICVFYEEKVKFLSYDTNGNFGFIQSGGGDLEVATPWTLAQAKELKYDQNADVMILCHEDVQQQELARTSATTFTVGEFVLVADPFDDAAAAGTTGYPACCRFYKGRLYFAAPKLKPTNVYGSNAGVYNDLTVGTDDDDGMAFQVADIAEKIEWLMDGNNSLIGGSNEALFAINGGSTSAPITPTTVEANVTNTDGSAPTQPVRKGDLLFYLRQDQRALDYFSYDILSESFQSHDANFMSYDITVGNISKLVYKKDRNDLLFTIRNDGSLLTLNFDQREKIVAWHEHDNDELTFKDIVRINDNDEKVQLFALVLHGTDYFICKWSEVVEFPLRDTFYTGDEEADTNATIRKYAELLKDCVYTDISSVVKNLFTSTITYVGDLAVGSLGTITSTAADFGAGDVDNRIVYKTATGLESGFFKITSFTSPTEVDVEVLAQPTSAAYSSWYLSFKVISGFTDFLGEPMSVVGDGGYLGDFVVDGSGEITLDREITVAVVGFKYTGLIRTFNLGPNIQGVNLQTTLKNLYRSGVRFVASAGGEIGTSQYNMVPIQKFDNVPSLFDAPPTIMDGDEYVNYNDTSDKEKAIYMRQTEPLPLNLTAIMSDVKFSTKN